jgi:hypothetical protein
MRRKSASVSDSPRLSITIATPSGISTEVKIVPSIRRL